MSTAALALALVACQPANDDCQKMFDKLVPLLDKDGGGHTMNDADRMKALSECRDGLAKHQDEALVKCVLGANGDDAIRACLAMPVKEYQAESKRLEARMTLDQIGKSAKRVFAETSAFPAGTSATLPPGPCCPGRCAVDAASWAKDPVWTALGFAIREPDRFQYAYRGSASAATVTAVGDVACTGKPITYTLHLDAKDGVPTAKIDDPTAH